MDGRIRKYWVDEILELKTAIFAAAAAAAAKIEKQITSGRPPVKKKLAPDGRTDEKKNEKIKVCLKR